MDEKLVILRTKAFSLNPIKHLGRNEENHKLCCLDLIQNANRMTTEFVESIKLLHYIKRNTNI